MGSITLARDEKQSGTAYGSQTSQVSDIIRQHRVSYFKKILQIIHKHDKAQRIKHMTLGYATGCLNGPSQCLWKIWGEKATIHCITVPASSLVSGLYGRILSNIVSNVLISRYQSSTDLPLTSQREASSRVVCSLTRHNLPFTNPCCDQDIVCKQYKKPRKSRLNWRFH